MKTFLVLVTVFACLVVANGVLTDYRSSLKHFLDRGPTKVRAEPAKKDIAVSVDGGDQEAESVAGKCGVSYNGQIGNLIGYYHFQVEKSSELEQVKECLESDQRVTHFEVQTYKTMVPKVRD